MDISTKFYEKQFTGNDKKETYLLACKWIAKNVINKVEMESVTYKIEKIESHLPTFKLTLYSVFDDKETTKSRCDRCKEFHRSFFINQDYNCDTCKMKSYKKEIKCKTKIKNDWLKSYINE